jgi:hypothetical protein
MIITVLDDIYQPGEIIKTLKAIDLYSLPVTQFREMLQYSQLSVHIKKYSV